MKLPNRLIREAWDVEGESRAANRYGNYVRFQRLGVHNQYRTVEGGSDQRLDVIIDAEYKTGSSIARLNLTRNDAERLFQALGKALG